MFLLLLVATLDQTPVKSDAQMIAFAIGKGRGEDSDAITADLYVCDLQGQHLRLVAKDVTEWIEHGGSGGTDSGDFEWSPDSQKLSFHRLHNHADRLYVVDRDGKKERLITPKGWSDTALGWTSNNEIAITRMNVVSDQDDRMIIDIRTRKQVKRRYLSRDYSPDHRFKLVDQDRNGWSDLDMIDRFTGKRTTIAKREEAGFMDAWSPDSKFISVNWGLDDRPVVVNTHTGHRIYGEKNSWVSDMLWSPNGRYLAYTSYVNPPNDPNRSGVVLLDVRTKRLKTLQRVEISERLVAWTRDNQYLIVLDDLDANRAALTLLPISGGNKKVILTRNIGSVALSGYTNYMRDAGGE